MITALLFKEFRLGFRQGETSLLAKVAKIVFTLLGGILFVVLLSFLTGALYDKLTTYSYAAPFHTLVFFLFIVLAVTILEGATRARKCLFDKGDSLVIAPLPIARYQVILSKMLYVYLVQLVELMLLSMPLLITFGVKVNFPYWYHVMSVVYCLLLSFFSTGLSFLLSLLFQVFYLLLKDRNLIQFVLASIVVVLLCYAYQVFLNLFLVSLSDSALTGTLSKDFVKGLTDTTFFLLPVFNMLDLFMGHDNILSNSLIILGLLVFALAAGYLSSDFALSKRLLFREREKSVDIASFRIESPKKALLKKELLLLFKDSSNTFSYTSVLIMLPFLSFVVLSSLKATLTYNLSVFLTYYPETLNVVFLSLFLLFVGIVNAGNALKPSLEGKALVVSKTLPYKPSFVLLVKLLCPSLLSLLSTTISLLVLSGTKTLSWPLFGVAFGASILLILSMNLLSLLGDVHDLGQSKAHLSFLSSMASYLVPLLVLALGLVLSFSGTKSETIYLVCFLISLVSLLPLFLFPPRRVDRLYRRMEVSA